MKRRDFVKKFGAIAASIPVIGYLIKPAQAENINSPVGDLQDTLLKSINPSFNLFDSKDLNGLIRKSFTTKKDSLFFFNNIPLIEYTDEEKLQEDIGKYGKCTIITADVLSTPEDAVVYGTGGSIEFVTNNVPATKIGARVGQLMLNRASRLKHPKNTDNIENDKNFYRDWIKTTAKYLALGIQQRMNTMTFATIAGLSVYNRHGISLLTKRPEGVVKEIPYEGSKFFPELQYQLEFMGTVYNKHFDTVTMNANTYFHLTGNKWNNTVEKISLNNQFHLSVKVYDEYFKERNNAGCISKINIIPDGVVLLSKHSNYNNPDILFCGYGITNENITDSLFGSSTPQTGVTGYFTDTTTPYSNSLCAWGVFRGMPLLKDSTAFSTLIFKDIPKDEDEI